MLTYITPIEELEKEAAEIYAYLSVHCSEDPNEAVQRGNEVQVYIARTGKMLADAKYHLDNAIVSNTMLVAKEWPSLPPSTKNRLIKGKCDRENYLLTLIERLNASATHHADWLRSVISKAKAEMQAGIL